MEDGGKVERKDARPRFRADVRVTGVNGPLVARALSPEGRQEVPRTRVRVEPQGDSVTLTVEAEDVNALRAAMNSYLRWMGVAMEAGDIGKGTDRGTERERESEREKVT
jgi:KEOPS complex subunit Pcc1